MTNRLPSQLEEAPLLKTMLDMLSSLTVGAEFFLHFLALDQGTFTLKNRKIWEGLDIQ